MAADSEFYLARAEQSMREADESELSNVRERCLRSAAAWRSMAEKAAKLEAARGVERLNAQRPHLALNQAPPGE